MKKTTKKNRIKLLKAGTMLALLATTPLFYTDPAPAKSCVKKG